jgi:tetratricopeptide (TPR) repeat protein
MLLEKALTAFHSALEEATRERAPVLWSMTQNNLGTTLGELGRREGSQAHLEEAATALRAALEERPQDKMPLPWATTQMSLANVLSKLGEHERGTAHFEEAAAHYEAALVVFLSANAYHQAGICRYNLDMTLVQLARRIVRGV